MSILSTILDLALDILTLIAILAGGYWSQKLYRQKRQKHPHANVTHEIFSFALQDGNRLIRLGIRIQNLGEVLIKIEKGEAWVQQVIPIHEYAGHQIEAREFEGNYGLEIDWPTIGNRKYWTVDPRRIEPHESDTIYLDFIVDTDAEVVNVYSHLENTSKQHWWSRNKKQPIGWTTESIHQLPEKQMAKQTSNIEKKATMTITGGETFQGRPKNPPQATAAPSPSPEVIRQGGAKVPPKAKVASNAHATPATASPDAIKQGGAKVPPKATVASTTQTDAATGNSPPPGGGSGTPPNGN